MDIIRIFCFLILLAKSPDGRNALVSAQTPPEEQVNTGNGELTSKDPTSEQDKFKNKTVSGGHKIGTLCDTEKYVLETELLNFLRCYARYTYNYTATIIKYSIGLEPTFYELCSESVRQRCVREFREAVEVCALTEAERIVRRDAIKALNAFNGFVCDKDSENLREFIEEAHSRECVDAENRLKHIYKCNRNYAELSILDYVWIRIVYRFDSDCMTQAEQTNCIYDVLDQCENKIARNFYTLLHMTVLNATRCKEMVALKYPRLTVINGCEDIHQYQNIYFIFINIILLIIYKSYSS